MSHLHKLDKEKREYASVLEEIHTALRSYKISDPYAVIRRLQRHGLSRDKEMVDNFNSLFHKRGFRLFHKGGYRSLDEDKIIFLLEFAYKDIRTRNKYKDALDNLRRIVDLQIKILKGSPSCNKKLMDRLQSERKKLRDYDPSLFYLLDEPVSRREFLRLGRNTAIASGIILLEPYLKSMAYAGDITNKVLGESSWINDWIKARYERFKPRADFVWKVDDMEISREQAETLLLEAMALAHYYLHEKPKKKIRVIVGSREIHDNMVAGYDMLDNTIHIGRIKMYARNNIASVVLMGNVLHETVHFIDNNYNFSHSIENKAVLKRWVFKKSLPKDKNEVEKRIDYAMSCLFKTELHAMTAQKKFFMMFIKEGKLDSRDTRIIKIAIKGVDKNLKQVHNGSYSGFQELRNLRQAMLEHF